MDIYKEAIVTAAADPQVQEMLGTPISEGWFSQSQIRTSSSSGVADLKIPISGPNGRATIYVLAEKERGPWAYRQLYVEIRETGQHIDLLSEKPKSGGG